MDAARIARHDSESALAEKNQLKTLETEKLQSFTTDLLQLNQQEKSFVERRTEQEKELIRLKTRFELEQRQIDSGQDELVTLKQLLTEKETAAELQKNIVIKAEDAVKTHRDQLDSAVTAEQELADQMAKIQKELSESEQRLRHYVSTVHFKT